MIGDLFDPKAEFFVEQGGKPHWSQTGAIVFGTFRTLDSIPIEVLDRWEREKQEWIVRALCRSPLAKQADLTMHWSRLLTLLADEDREKFNKHFERCRESKLDECHGACVLKNPVLSKIVADSLMHFDGDRYRMGDFVIMPNHVHLLAAFNSPETMRKQFASWLRFTAREINQCLNSNRHFWQQEPFDHLVRSPEQYQHLRNYIKCNPEKAGLRSGEYFYRRYQY